MAVVVDCTAAQVVVECAAEGGGQLASIWALVNGVWCGYTVGAPWPVNANFPGLTAGQAIYVRRA